MDDADIIRLLRRWGSAYQEMSPYSYAMMLQNTYPVTFSERWKTLIRTVETREAEGYGLG